MKPETRTILKLSTAHITLETSKLLDSLQLSDWPVFGTRFEPGFGYLIWVDEDFTGPEDLGACITYATGYDFIWLDSEGPVVPELRAYTW